MNRIKADNEKELIMVLDDDGNETGRIETRAFVHQNGLFHYEVAVFVINGSSILLEKRSKAKKFSPGKLCAPGGHVCASESIIDAAVKEIKEEIGLEIKKDDIYFLQRFKKVKPDNKSFKTRFYMFTDKTIEQLEIQKSEVDEVVYMNIDDFIDKTKNTDETTYIYNEEQELLEKLSKIVKQGGN